MLDEKILEEDVKSNDIFDEDIFNTGVSGMSMMGGGMPMGMLHPKYKKQSKYTWKKKEIGICFIIGFLLSGIVIYRNELNAFFTNPIVARFSHFLSLGCAISLVIMYISACFFIHKEVVKVDYCFFNDIYSPNKYKGINKSCIERVAKKTDDLEYKGLDNDYIETEFELRQGDIVSSLGSLKYIIYYSKKSNSFFIRNENIYRDPFFEDEYLRVFRNPKRKPKGVDMTHIFTKQEIGLM